MKQIKINYEGWFIINLFLNDKIKKNIKIKKNNSRQPELNYQTCDLSHEIKMTQ